ncbi:MAG: dihydrolipoyl dehydrogenase [Deltaproteobacteria bacterium]|nr:dihydrolipoyl dehydrogenase [Deltaproteobacteria bacterium]
MATRVAIIGAGPGGYVAAARAAQLGGEVTLIEKEGVGGTCLNWGCIPTKIMKRTADLMEDFRRADEFGISMEGTLRTDMKRVMARKQELIREQAQGILNLLKHRKVTFVKGRGTVAGHGLVTVIQENGRQLEVPWDRLILALGAQPLEIPAFPFDGNRVLSSNHALSLSEVPRSVLIVGGGVVGCEFAFIFASLGSEVTVVEAMSRILPIESVDEDCSTVLQREMKKRKIKFLVNRVVQSVDEDGDQLRVTVGQSPFAQEIKRKEQKTQTVHVDKVLVCIGRTPNTSGAGLETVGVRTDARGWIPVHEHMETDVRGVYAIGDVLGPSKVMLAHVASTEGIVAAENVMGASRLMNYEVVPGAVFTSPEIANVGLTEVQARERGIPVRCESVLFRTLGKAHVIGEIAGMAKLVTNRETGRILGVHIIGAHATDLIAEGALAVQIGATVRDLAETIHAHPTLSEVMLEVSFKALDLSAHEW